MSTPPPVPRVFISSTVEDLTAHRTAAKEAAIECDFLPKLCEYWAAADDHPPLGKCLREVGQTDLLVVIVAHRYGWIPADQPAPGRKSITWLECEQAVRDGHEVLAFVIEDGAAWAPDQREESSLVAAVRENRATPALLQDIQDRTQRLKDFKEWLRSRATRATFVTAEELRRKVVLALTDWRQRHSPQPAGSDRSPSPADPTCYLTWLRDETGFIDIRGLQVGGTAAHRFPIDDLYMALTTPRGIPEPAGSKKPRRKGRRSPGPADLMAARMQPAEAPLQEALCHDRLVVTGDPGAGKTTFLRRIAHTLSQTRLGSAPEVARPWLALPDRTFPLYLRLGVLADHLRRCGRSSDAPPTPDAPAWLVHFLAACSTAHGWGLDAGFFRQQLESGLATVMLDGLDEAPDRATRERLSALIEHAVRAYPGCRFVVTSRPSGYVALAGFVQTRIAPLSDAATETFLRRWCGFLYQDDPDSARNHCLELLGALRARPEIRRMARNPVMLTALAVVHWNERRLPEQRADLYESIIKWLSRAREQREGREKADRTVFLLQELALAMQQHPDGMQTAVKRRWAAEQLAPHRNGGRTDQAAIRDAESFLEAEELDSGIIVDRGGQLQFWHRTFQEFLAARAIASRPDQEQNALLWGPPVRVYQPEWREVILLLAGTLHEQGPAKVDALLKGVLDALRPAAKLAARARAVGLLGAILRDLDPVGYKLKDARYRNQRQMVMTIFDAEHATELSINVRIEAADALGQAGDPRIDAHRRDYWLEIPAGEFLMGAQSEDSRKPNYDPEAQTDEGPVHPVTLAAFRVARYPVTVGQFQHFMEQDGYTTEAYWEVAGGFGKHPQPEGWDAQQPFPTRPVVGVSWYEAMAFVAWFSELVGSTVTLPSEAQWERAARGTTGRRYPWGAADADETRLNFAMDFGQPNVGHPTPVGIYPAGNSPEGASDLAGNVWEWTRSLWGKQGGQPDYCYPYHPGDDREELKAAGDIGRVLRGGSWDFPADYARCAYRVRLSPDYRFVSVGFRVVASPFRASGL